ncbi:MAG: hypothetical protein A2901_03945 [Elusimicrobia bacterium RIFCSPLOWO2_01_FULL_54_10]|nr:MAG: hypothetical protein A2901_03945 [Elusimicrobia bacterium RIFCSPLOWO2_01_FULL_54_10]
MKKYIAGLGVIAALGMGAYWLSTGGGEEVLVRVEKGESARAVARKLEEQGVIPSSFWFLALSRLSGASRSIHYGPYLFNKGRTWQTVRKLSRGETFRLKISIPEGWAAFQIGQRLQQEGIIPDAEAFAKLADNRKLEGRLFPSTYFFEPGSDTETVLNAFVEHFRRMVPAEMGVSTKTLTLASIIEREAVADDERTIISSVYHNRLRAKRPLEADPTVQYAIGKGRFWKERIFYKDLNVKSPYNTYRNRGLPPGPICNPGLKSIEAALNPAQTPYFYFVADGTGRHQFFKDHKSHLEWQRQNRRRKK